MSGRRARGFTLVEVVVALALLAVILTGLISALVTFARTSDRVDQRTQAGDDVRLVYAFLSQSLGPADPRMRTRPDDAVTLSWMQGTATELVWLGLMPARHGVGGLFHLRLGFQPFGPPRHFIERAIRDLQFAHPVEQQMGPRRAPVGRRIFSCIGQIIEHQPIGSGRIGREPQAQMEPSP